MRIKGILSEAGDIERRPLRTGLGETLEVGRLEFAGQGASPRSVNCDQ